MAARVWKIQNKLLFSNSVTTAFYSKLLSRRLATLSVSSTLSGEIPKIFEHVCSINQENTRILNTRYTELLERAKAGGGRRGIERHTQRNKKMLARNRIKLLLDENSPSIELSALAGIDLEYGDIPCAGLVTVIGKVHGIWCMVIANDATVKGGSIYPITLKKQLRAQRVAEENLLPTIYLVDSGGAFLPLQSEIFNEGGKGFYNQAIMSSKGITQTALVCGSCTAGAAYIPTMADEAVILHQKGTIFLGGPPLVYAATGERVTPEELGGATLHCDVSGVTDHFARSEEDALLKTRDIIATLNVTGAASAALTTAGADVDENAREANDEKLDKLAPARRSGCQLDPRYMLSAIVDRRRFHEFKERFGKTLVTGFGAVEGRLAGFVASNGRLTESAAVKGTHFVQLCSQRRIPLVFLQHFDGEDSALGTTEEVTSATIKGRAQLMQAVCCSQVPSIAITTGGVTGTPESHALGSLSTGARFHFMFPNARVGYASPERLTTAVADCDGADSARGVEKLRLYERFRRETESFHAAARVRNDGVILPRHARSLLANCLDVFRQADLMHATASSQQQQQTYFRM